MTGYFTGAGAIAGTAFGFGQSGILPDPDNLFGNATAFVLATAAGVNRFPPIAGSEGADALTAAEVHDAAVQGARGRVRRRAARSAGRSAATPRSRSRWSTPPAQVLGIVRTPDAPVFGTDVSLQKARTAMFFSNPAAGRRPRCGPPAAGADRRRVPDSRRCTSTTSWPSSARMR